MILNRAKFDAELVAAGVAVKGYNADGPQAGRAVLADGTIVGHDGRLSHDSGREPDAAGARAYLEALAAHDPTPTAAQAAATQRRREADALGGRDSVVAALALRLSSDWWDRPVPERAAAQAVIDEAAQRVRAARE